MTGSSFRTGADMAASGDTVPVSFTVENRGGADPGNFQVQVLLSDEQPVRQFRRRCWRRSPAPNWSPALTGRDFSSPSRFQRHRCRRACLRGKITSDTRIVPDPSVPEAGLYDKSGVHRGEDWETAHDRSPERPRGRPTCRASMPACSRKTPGTAGPNPGGRVHLHGDAAAWATES